MTLHQKNQHIWISASAGTGKTKRLSDRYLSLLLQDVDPWKILCLTFTKAAAAEMSMRIQMRLAAWQSASDDTLRTELEALFGEAVAPELLEKARNLFFDVIDHFESLRIQTIHSFAQSLVATFPLEVNAPLFFDLVDDLEKKALLTRAREAILVSSDLASVEAWQTLFQSFTPSDLFDLIDKILCDRFLFQMRPETPEMTKAALRLFLKLEAGEPSQWIQNFYDRTQRMHAEIEVAIGAFTSFGTSSEQEKVESFKIALKNPQNVVLWWKNYGGLFLNQAGDIRKQLATKKVQQGNPSAYAWMEREAERVHALDQQLKAYPLYLNSSALSLIVDRVAAGYAQLKSDRGVLDYDDLIHKAFQLLSDSEHKSWVQYRMDHKIEHIMVDEAQDTNAYQWRIIQALSEEFFSVDGHDLRARSLFVVGDEKQSIYSFQGANAALFQSVKHFFKSQIEEDSQWRDHALTLSYRSSLPILRVTDDVFNRAGLLGTILEESSPLKHDSFLKDHYGRVSLWPLIRPLEGDTTSKDMEEEDRSLKADLAYHIASTIRQWLDSGRLLHTKARPIAPSDILILVQKRDDFFFHMITALQQQGVPVGGADRLCLNDQLAFKDLLALGRFLLNPEDDFSLSLTLKSPFFGFDEQLVFHLSHGREESSLWSRLRQATDPLCVEASGQLSKWLNTLDQQTPYQFYADILYVSKGASKMAARQGESAFEFIQEFLNLALQSQNHSSLSFEGFIQWLETETFEIKRDFSLNTLNTVRVMTVHGAKGLEAPIVFVSDAARLSVNPSKYFWHAFEGQDLLIHKGTKAVQPSVLEAVAADHQEAERDEYFRKLYVALTRATTELYITGWKSARTSMEGSWYSYLEQTMRALHTASDHFEAKKMGLSEEADLTYHVIHEGVSKSTNPASALIPPPPLHPLPEWVDVPLPLVQQPNTRDLSKVVPPQGGASDTYATRRGTFVHKLLEELPRLPKDRHRAAMMHYLKSVPEAKTLEAEADALLNQAQTIITHPDFMDLFDSNSYPEVVLYDASLDKSVRLDRLVVREHEVLIVEYKTGVVTTEGAKLQEQYRVQMQGYKAYVERLYPKHRVRSFILAVDNLRLLEIDDL